MCTDIVSADHTTPAMAYLRALITCIAHVVGARRIAAHEGTRNNIHRDTELVRILVGPALVHATVVARRTVAASTRRSLAAVAAIASSLTLFPGALSETLKPSRCTGGIGEGGSVRFRHFHRQSCRRSSPCCQCFRSAGRCCYRWQRPRFRPGRPA